MNDRAAQTELLRPDGRYDAEIDLRQYVVALRRRRWMIALVTIVCGVVAWAVSWFSPTTYLATARLYVGEQVGDNVDYFSRSTPIYVDGMLYTVATPRREVSADVAKYRVILEGSEVASAVVGELGLHQPPINISPSQFQSELLEIRLGSPANVLLVEVRFTDPALAARTATSTARRATTIARRQDSATARRQEAEFKESQRLLEEARTAVEVFHQQAQIELMRETAETLKQQRSQLSELLAQTQVDTAQLDMAEEQLAQAGTTSLPDGRLSREVASTRQRLAALEARRDYLLETRKEGQSQLNELTTLVGRLSRLEADVALALRQRLLAERLVLARTGIPSTLPAEFNEWERMVAQAQLALSTFKEESQIDWKREAAQIVLDQHRQLSGILTDIQEQRARLRMAEDVLARTPPRIVVNLALERNVASIRRRLITQDARRRYLMDAQTSGASQIRKLPVIVEETLAQLHGEVIKIGFRHDQLAAARRAQIRDSLTGLRLLDEALVPDAPVARRVARNISAGLAFGLFLSIMSVFFIHAFKRSAVATPQDGMPSSIGSSV